MAKFGILSPTHFLCLMSIAMQICIATSYNVLDFGAVPNGKTDSTSAFAGAWMAACKSNKESTVVVPRGTFFVNSVSFNGPCKNEIRFRITGSIVAPCRSMQEMSVDEVMKEIHAAVDGGDGDAARMKKMKI